MASSSSPTSSTSSPLSTKEHDNRGPYESHNLSQGLKIPPPLAVQSLPPDTLQVPLSTPTKQMFFHPQFSAHYNSKANDSVSAVSSTTASACSASDSASIDSSNTTINSETSTPGIYGPSSLSPLHYATKKQVAPPLPPLPQMPHFPQLQLQQQQQQQHVQYCAPSPAPAASNKEKSNIDGTAFPQTFDLSVLTPIPGCMAYRHPLIPVIPSASGNTRKQTRRLFDAKTNSITEGPIPDSSVSTTASAGHDNDSDSSSIDSSAATQARRMAFGSPTWTQKDDELLRHLKEVEKIGWRDISMYFPTRTINACQFRWRRLIMKEENRRKRELHKSALRARLVK